jgi:hypothetical protein
MYFIAEVTHSTKRIIQEAENLRQAEELALQHNLRSRVSIEILDERCKVIKLIQQYFPY